MTSSLIPEKPIQVSPSLAATIGLEEATMLSVLDELANHRQLQAREGYHWLQLTYPCVLKHMPFWTDYDIQRISKSLCDKGVLRLASAPFGESRELHFAFNEQVDPGWGKPVESPKTSQAHNAITRGGSVIPPNWQPSEETLTQIVQHNIPQSFVRENIAEFVAYWRESGESRRSWGSKFRQYVQHKWSEHQTLVGRRDLESPMQDDWYPSPDAMEVMVKHAGINRQFVEDAISEFVLYWRERGDLSRTWNSKFIQHVRRQWTRYTSALEHDTEPRRIAENWQPSDDVYDVLRLANIDLVFAQQLVSEFVLFWRDSNQLHISWNTKFLQHVKYHWAKRNIPSSIQGQGDGQQQLIKQSARTRDRSIKEQLKDRSWAL